MIDQIRNMDAVRQPLVFDALNKKTKLGATDIDLFMDLRGRHHIIGEFKYCPMSMVPPLRCLPVGQKLALTSLMNHAPAFSVLFLAGHNAPQHQPICVIKSTTSVRVYWKGEGDSWGSSTDGVKFYNTIEEVDEFFNTLSDWAKRSYADAKRG